MKSLVFLLVLFAISSSQKPFRTISLPLLSQLVKEQPEFQQLLRSSVYDVQVQDSYRQSYFTPLLIGTPPQTFLVSIDTGSSDLWVSGVSCQTTGCKSHHRFNPSLSSTFKSTSTSFSIHYLGGDTTGVIGKDNIKLGELQANQIAFGISSQSSTLFDKVKFDGVMGLAFNSISSLKQPTVVDALYQQNQIDINSFSIFLSENQNSLDSLLVLGGIDESIAKIEEFKFYPIIRQMQYVLQANYISFNGTNTPITQVVIDSGTSTISGDQSILGPIFDSFPSQIDCQNMGQYPVLIFNIGGDDYQLDPEDYIYSYTSQGILYCRVGLKYFSLKTPGQIILGDTFMRRYYTLFDKQNNRVGFAPLKKSISQEDK